MSNLPNPNPSHREVPPQQNGQVDLNAIPPKVDPEKAVSYRDGYVHGRVSERHVQEDRLEVRDNNNAARGLIIGIGLTSLLGLTLGSLFFFNQREQVEEYSAPPVVVPSAVSPASPSPSPAAAQQPRQETQVIERTNTIERPVLVPVPQSPVPQKAPQVNVTVPPAAPQNNTPNVTPAQTQPRTITPAQPNSTTQPRTTTPAQPNSTTQTTPSQQPTQIQPSLVAPTAPNQTQGQNSSGNDNVPSATPNGANTPATGSTRNNAAGSSTTSGTGQ